MGVSELPERYEYGYRLRDGTECWERPADGDETRILAHERLDIGAIELHDDGDDVVEVIQRALVAADVDAVVLRRLVATTVRDTEVIAKVTSAERRDGEAQATTLE